jgi:hypothetical protein
MWGRWWWKHFSAMLNRNGEESKSGRQKMATESKVTVPKKGDRVGTDQQEGVFEVVLVNALMQTANIRLADGTGHVIPNVPWTDLKALDKK